MITNFPRNAIVVSGVVVVVTAVAAYRHQAPTAPDNKAAPSTTTQPGGLPRMVDLGADKCIPCKKMAPILVELKAEYAGRATIEFIDVWKNPGAGENHRVRLIPTQIFYDRTGHEVWRHEGFLAREEIVAKLTELGAG